MFGCRPAFTTALHHLKKVPRKLRPIEQPYATCLPATSQHNATSRQAPRFLTRFFPSTPDAKCERPPVNSHHSQRPGDEPQRANPVMGRRLEPLQNAPLRIHVVRHPLECAGGVSRPGKVGPGGRGVFSLVLPGGKKQIHRPLEGAFQEGGADLVGLDTPGAETLRMRWTQG